MFQLKTTNFISLFFVLFLLFSCSKTDESSIDSSTENETTNETVSKKPNIIFVIADDMGLDATPGYQIGTTKPTMPNLQQLMQTGITYTNVWSNPTCSPTRATIITGKYGIKTGVLTANDVLNTSETTLQKYIDTNLNSEYSSAIIGKWYLSNNKTHPESVGIEYYAGFIPGTLPDYWNWDLTENGSTTKSSIYNTTAYTNIAINWVEKQTKPWFLWLAYNAPHTPFHLPPTELHSQGNLPTDQASINNNPLPYYLASLEAMDTEFGRLLSSLSSEEREIYGYNFYWR